MDIGTLKNARAWLECWRGHGRFKSMVAIALKGIKTARAIAEGWRYSDEQRAEYDAVIALLEGEVQ